MHPVRLHSVQRPAGTEAGRATSYAHASMQEDQPNERLDHIYCTDTLCLDGTTRQLVGDTAHRAGGGGPRSFSVRRSQVRP